jgi:hypothetical protein
MLFEGGNVCLEYFAFAALFLLFVAGHENQPLDAVRAPRTNALEEAPG